MFKGPHPACRGAGLSLPRRGQGTATSGSGSGSGVRAPRAPSAAYAAPPTTPDRTKLQSTPPVSAGSGPSYSGVETARRPSVAPIAQLTVARGFQPARNQ